MTIAKFFTHYPTRKLEWCIAMYTIGFGLWLMLPTEAMNTASFRGVLSMMSEGAWGRTYTLIGLAHVFALHVNGRSAVTPFLRLSVLLANSGMFQAMFWAVLAANPWGTAVFTYGFFAIGFCGPAIATAGTECGKELKILRARGRNVGH